MNAEPRAARAWPGVLAASALAVFLIPLILSLAGCSTHRHGSPGGAPRSADVEAPPAGSPGSSAPADPPPSAGRATAFAADARLQVEERARSMKMRFYAAAPDRFRMELRGPVGGIALIATGRGGKVRIVVPSRRRYAEGNLQDDVGTGLLGIPLRGCDLAMVMRISSGMPSFQPCTDPEPEEAVPPGPAERPGLIVDTSVSGDELLRFGFDWSAEGRFPKEAWVEIEGTPSIVLFFRGFRSLDFPAATAEDFFWEPVPASWNRVPLSELSPEEGAS